MKNKKNIIMIMLVALISLFGIAYAFFEYYGIGTNQEIKAGMVSLRLNEGTDTISVTNAFPETIEQARDVKRTDNEITFTISGTNTSEDDDLYYEIMLNEGEDESGKTRYNPSDLMFDLIEIDENGNETMVVDAMNFDDFNERRIWVNTIKKGTTTEITKTYKLRMWLSEDVIISDSNPNANYPASNYKNTYGSVKISVYGDMKEKSSPYNYFYGTPNETEEGISYWPEAIDAQKANITEVKFVSMNKSAMNKKYDAATIKADVTDTTKSIEKSVLTWLETDTTDSSKYVMYVASDGITFFPSVSSAMFAMFENLKNVSFENINTRDITNMMLMFAMCSNLTDVNLSNFDTSNVTDITFMFAYCSNLTSADLSSFNTDKLEGVEGIFGLCSNLKSVNLSGWNISNVTSFSDLFLECSNLTNINLSNWELGMNYVDLATMLSELQNLNLNLSGWDVKHLLMLDNMFAEWTNLVSLDLSNWNTKYIMSMSGMFNGCSNLTTLNLSGWNTENVTNMSMMFAECEKLTSLDVSHFNTRNVTNMMGMFGVCTSLTKLDVSNFNTSNVTDMSVMFAYCSGLTELNLSNFNTSNVGNIYGMFAECSNLMSLDISNFVINDNIKDDSELYVNVFFGMNDNCIVKVKSKDEQEWILSLGTMNVPSSWTTENVIVKG